METPLPSHPPSRRRARSRLLALVAALAAAPAAAPAQGLPAFAPVNPLASSRSGLSFEPYRDPASGWRTEITLEYASTIEVDAPPATLYLLDSELMRAGARVTRDIGRATFVLAEGGIGGGYDGFLDGFVDWYHDLLGVRMPEREARPRNAFTYAVNLPDGTSFQRDPHDLFLTDLRLGVGRRYGGRLQALFTVTLPLGAPEGFGRRTVSANVHTTVRVPVAAPLVFEGGFDAGATPARGELERYQRELFVAGSGGLRWRFWGRQSLYANLFYHSPYYHDTGVDPLDRHDLALDFGWIIAGPGGGELRLGMTEDPEPSGPGIDLVFRIGGRL